MIPARLNPFRTERVERLPFRFADGWHWERLFAELKSRGFRAAIVGPHGSGKTTLLEQLGERLVGNAGRDLCGSQEHRSAEHCSARQSQQTRGAMLRAPLAQPTFAEISIRGRSPVDELARNATAFCKTMTIGGRAPDTFRHR